MDINPPDFSGPVYPSFVARVDADGNDIAGIRLPPVVAAAARALEARRFLLLEDVQRSIDAAEARSAPQ